MGPGELNIECNPVTDGPASYPYSDEQKYSYAIKEKTEVILVILWEGLIALWHPW